MAMIQLRSALSMTINEISLGFYAYTTFSCSKLYGINLFVVYIYKMNIEFIIYI